MRAKNNNQLPWNNPKSIGKTSGIQTNILELKQKIPWILEPDSKHIPLIGYQVARCSSLIQISFVWCFCLQDFCSPCYATWIWVTLKSVRKTSQGRILHELNLRLFEVWSIAPLVVGLAWIGVILPKTSKRRPTISGERWRWNSWIKIFPFFEDIDISGKRSILNMNQQEMISISKGTAPKTDVFSTRSI